MYTHRLSRLVAPVLFLSMILLASCAASSEPAIVGTWTSTVTKEDVLRVMPDFQQEFLCENTGTFVWQFSADGTFTIDQTALPECPVPANTHIEDTWSIDGNLITFAKDTPNQEVYEWSVEGNKLVFRHESGECIPCIAVNTANPWTRVE